MAIRSTRFLNSKRARIDQTSFTFNASFWPVSFPSVMSPWLRALSRFCFATGNLQAPSRRSSEMAKRPASANFCPRVRSRQCRDRVRKVPVANFL